MVEIIKKSTRAFGINDIELQAAIEQSVREYKGVLKKVLLLPPDLTRLHSGAGRITAMYYNMLKKSCRVDIMPALGTHDPMTEEECLEMFGKEVPYEHILVHNWRSDIVKVGEVPGEYIEEVSEGLIDYSIDVQINKRLIDGSYDLIISIGQVVPHEVVGMANYSKNIFIGCGGRDMINKSHMLGAVYGMEKIMGRDHSPVRKVFDYAEKNFMKNISLMYVLTVTTVNEGNVTLEGLFAGRSRKLFEEAVALSRQKNLIFLDREINKAVVYLDEREFKSTWLGNKSVYRTRMAVADDGELLVIAPGVRKFGEDMEVDSLIRKYGYTGRRSILEMYKKNDDLKQNLSAAAHMIHGSSDERFGITYAPGYLSKEEIESVNFGYMPLGEALEKYNPEKLKDGFNTLEDGEEIFYISNPAVGLWAYKEKFK